MHVQNSWSYGKESMKLASGLKLKQLKQCLADQNFLPWMHQVLCLQMWPIQKNMSWLQKIMAKQVVPQVQVRTHSISGILHIYNYLIIFTVFLNCLTKPLTFSSANILWFWLFFIIWMSALTWWSSDCNYERGHLVFRSIACFFFL